MSAAAVSKQVRLLRRELPALLRQLEQIPDARDPFRIRLMGAPKPARFCRDPEYAG